MRHLYVMDPIETVNPEKDTTFAFLLEAQARGVDCLVCGVADLWAEGGRGFARARRVEVQRPDAPDARFFTVKGQVDVPFSDVDVIWMRKDPPVDDAFLFATMILDRADP